MVTGRVFDHLRLREARLAANMSQVELAEALDVKQATVSMWENGTRSPHATKVKSIAALLRIRPEELMLGDLHTDTLTLGDHRQAAGLSQAGLAARLEVRPRYVADIEIGRYWSDDVVEQWCALLGITPEQFRTAWWTAREARRTTS